MPEFETVNDRRNRIAQELLAQQMAQEQQFDIKPHSPTSSFDFAAGFSPAASMAAIGMFDPAGSSPTMQGGAPTATGRDAFSGAPAPDWGGVNDFFGNSPLAEPTMTAPDMTSSPNATPTFDVDQNGMPNAPDMTPAAPNESGSLTDPGGGALGALGMGDLGSLADGNAAADNTGGSEGVG